MQSEKKILVIVTFLCRRLEKRRISARNQFEMSEQMYGGESITR